MEKIIKIISFGLCLAILIVSVSCTGDPAEDDTPKVSQKAYNTAFQTATTVEPNSITESEETTVQTQVIESDVAVVETMPATVKRSGKKPVFEQTTDMRKISSKQLLSQLGTGITLGDSFTARGLPEGAKVEDYETYFGNPVVTKELIDAYKKAGFSIVRIPVSFGEHLDESGFVADEWLVRINEVVDYVLDNGMYCIISAQNEQIWLTTSSKKLKETKQKFNTMWTSIANRFERYNDHLLFEGVSEILKAENDKSAPSKSDLKNANAINQEFVNAVRATGGKNKQRHLVVSTYGSFIDSATLDGFTVPKDSAKNKLIAKVNIYVPSSFCIDENQKNIWGSKEDKQYIDSIFSVVNSRFSELKIPVIVGEFGAVDKGNITARQAYANYFVSTAYNYYIVCFWNDNGNTMSIFNRKSAEVSYEKIVNAMKKAVK